MVLIISTWQWGPKYSAKYVDRLQSGLERYLRQPWRFELFHPLTGDETLHVGCFCRLRMFSPDFQMERSINRGDRLVCLDLDLVITGPLDPLFDRPESFVIWQGCNAPTHPCPFNGSVMMLRAGEHADVWDTFSLEAARKIPFADFPDDQGWIHHQLPDAAGWQVGPSSGIYAFRKAGWPVDDRLPADARIVAFPGRRDPQQFEHLTWMANWR